MRLSRRHRKHHLHHSVPCSSFATRQCRNHHRPHRQHLHETTHQTPVPASLCISGMLKVLQIPDADFLSSYTACCSPLSNSTTSCLPSLTWGGMYIVYNTFHCNSYVFCTTHGCGYRSEHLAIPAEKPVERVRVFAGYRCGYDLWYPGVFTHAVPQDQAAAHYDLNIYLILRCSKTACFFMATISIISSYYG
jgi:hypothetical protein